MCRIFFRGALRALFFLVVSISLAASAEAAKFHFGADEKLHVVGETKIVNDGKPISLCYKSYSYFLLGGVYTTDEYVLCEGGTSTRYWPMPAGAELTSMQQQGFLPSPLPAYERPVIDYVMGYSLWLLIAIVAVWAYFDRGRAKAAAPKNLALLKTTLRRMMASAAATSPVPDSSATVARGVYEQVFGEPLAEADFATDWHWVQEQPATFDGFVGAMGRQFDDNAKSMLLRTTARVAMADGILGDAEAALLRHLAAKLGFKPNDVEGFVTALREQSAAPGTQAA